MRTERLQRPAQYSAAPIAKLPRKAYETELLRRADGALYAAKVAGRDRLLTEEGTPPESTVLPAL